MLNMLVIFQQDNSFSCYRQNRKTLFLKFQNYCTKTAAISELRRIFLNLFLLHTSNIRPIIIKNFSLRGFQLLRYSDQWVSSIWLVYLIKICRSLCFISYLGAFLLFLKKKEISFMIFLWNTSHNVVSSYINPRSAFLGS